MKNRYIELGWGLLIAGMGLAPVAYLLLRSVPLISLGMAMVVSGAVCLVLGRTMPKISPEVGMLLMNTGLENLSSLLEELGLKSKGMYLPSHLTGGKPRAIIPLYSNPRFPVVSEPLAERLIVSCGNDPEDMGILVTTAGSNVMGMLEMEVGTSSDELAAALTTILAGTLDVAAGVKVEMNGSEAEVTVSHPRLGKNENSWAEQSLGSPIASITASLLAEALDAPVTIESEELTLKEDLIKLRILHIQDKK